MLFTVHTLISLYSLYFIEDVFFISALTPATKHHEITAAYLCLRITPTDTDMSPVRITVWDIDYGTWLETTEVIQGNLDH